MKQGRELTCEAMYKQTQVLFELNEANITHYNSASLLSAWLPVYSISLTTKTVSPDLASDVKSKLDTSVWLSIMERLFGMLAALFFLSHSQLC